MDHARLQTVINKGYRIAASRIGAPFVHYRPASATSVIEPNNIVTAELPASFAQFGSQFSFDRPDSEKDYLNNGLFDADVVAVGDYLVGEPGAWFVGSKEPIKPPLCVRCNRTISIAQLGGGNCHTVGLGTYSGASVENENVVLSGWPVSMKEASGLRASYAGLPFNVGAQGVQVLMPSFGVEIEPGMSMSDDLGRRFLIKSAEQTHVGWRFVAVEASA